MRIALPYERRWYEPIEMTTALWKSVPLHTVRLEDLVLQQDEVSIKKLLTPYDSHDDYPLVVEWNGTLYLENGHHRVMKRLLGGHATVLARVLVVGSDRGHRHKTVQGSVVPGISLASDTLEYLRRSGTLG